MPLLGMRSPMRAMAWRKAVAVLGLLDGLDGSPDQLDPVFFQHAHAGHFHGGVESRLAAEGRQQGVGPFLFDDQGPRSRA